MKNDTHTQIFVLISTYRITNNKWKEREREKKIIKTPGKVLIEMLK